MSITASFDCVTMLCVLVQAAATGKVVKLPKLAEDVQKVQIVCIRFCDFIYVN